MAWYPCRRKSRLPESTMTVTAKTYTDTFYPTSGTVATAVTVNPTPSQSKTATPTTSQQTITPDTGYLLSSVTVEAAQSTSVQSGKQATVTPEANWSGAYTNYSSSITPDSGYDAMSSVQVRVPMIRDNCLVSATAVDTPGTVYNGDTSQSNSAKLLRIAPSKTGMAYTGSYLYLKPNSYLGNASASNVLSGTTFSSSNGIQVSGSMTDKTGWSKTGSSGEKVYIPAGYHPGTTYVQCPTSGTTPSGTYSATTRTTSASISSYATLDTMGVPSTYDGWHSLWEATSYSGSVSASTKSTGKTVATKSGWTRLLRIGYLEQATSGLAVPTYIYIELSGSSTDYLVLFGGTSTSTMYARGFQVTSTGGSITWTDCKRVGATTTGNTYAIPYSVEYAYVKSDLVN